MVIAATLLEHSLMIQLLYVISVFSVKKNNHIIFYLILLFRLVVYLLPINPLLLLVQLMVSMDVNLMDYWVWAMRKLQAVVKIQLYGQCIWRVN
jgi:hypothetical protein